MKRNQGAVNMQGQKGSHENPVFIRPSSHVSARRNTIRDNLMIVILKAENKLPKWKNHLANEEPIKNLAEIV